MASRFWVGGSGTWDVLSTANWSATSGGAAGATAPTILDTATFDANSGTGTVSVAATAVSLNTTVNSSGAALSLTGSPTLCTAAGTLTLTLGTISLNTYTLTCGKFSSSNANVRSVAFGTGKFNITGNNATVWTMSDANNFTYSGTPNVEFSYSASTGTRTIRQASNVSGGGTETNSPSFLVTAGSDTVNMIVRAKNLNFTGFSGTMTSGALTVYGNLTCSSGMTWSSGTSATTFSATSGTQQITTAGKTLDFPLTFNGIGGTFAFQDALTQGSTRAFTITNGTVQLKAGTTSTVGAFTTSGTNQKFLQSTLAGSQATLSQASGTVSASYLTIKDINATGGATWNAFVDQSNIDAGNVDGWNFGISPVVSGAEYTYALRSFTQPRRF